MKSPRFLAALAMAAVLTTGVTAHAAASAPNALPDGQFVEITGSGANGQTPIQQGQKYSNAPVTAPAPADIEMQGDIQVDGTFTKRINNFPVPDKEGRYLRVTMPIKMDFAYDVDTDTMTAAEAVVTNNSVLAVTAKTPGPNHKYDITDEQIEMSIVGFVKNTTGRNTIGSEVEFVQDVKAALTNTANDDKILLPFELQMESQTGKLKPYAIETIVKNQSSLQPIQIPARGTVKLKLDKIQGESLGNEHLITKHTSLTSHNLQLRFEYKGN